MRTRARRKHPFRFKVSTNDGKQQILTAWAKVTPGTNPVVLDLNAEDVRQSMKLGGVGNTQTCSMAVCAKRQKGKFTHPVEAYIDWQYRMAYVVTKVSKATGLPTACVSYAHGDDIAKINDSKSGQEKLLQQLLTAGGSRKIYLRPAPGYKDRKGKPRGNTNKSVGSKTSRPAGTGAKLRFAVAQLGGVA